MENENKEKKERGGCLTAFLIVFIVLYSLGILGSLLSAAMGSSSNEALNKMFGSVPTWSYATSVILDIVNIVGLVFILKWKKIGAYLFIGSAVVSFVISIITSASIVSTIVGGLIGYAIIFGIFYYVIHPIWNNLE